ncbi:MAG: MFS transporter [Sphingomonadales bacterium]|nr:MFS transporter [Sphingomonadales bacterium]
MDRLKLLGISGAFVAVAALFFAWGFVSSNNDPLIVALRAAFDLSYSQALQIQLVSFLANGVMSFPAASLGNRIGAANTIVVALGTMVAGCLLVRLGLAQHSYPAVLAAMFVLALGITTLQVSANPLAAALGPTETSHFRLNFAQSFNSLGVVIGVNYGASIMLGDKVMAAGQGTIRNAAERHEVLGAVSGAFGSMAAVLLVLGLFLFLQRRRVADAVIREPIRSSGSVLDALRSRWALFGALSIGLYVGAEVSIGSIMITFLHQQSILGLPLEQAGFYLANLYWGGALIGRIVGTILLTRVEAAKLLCVCAVAAMLLCLAAFAEQGWVSGVAALAIGLFNSIMFPTIFTLTLERSGVSRSATSGLLVLAISFGAVIPYLVALSADTTGLSSAFIIPAFAYGVIVTFAVFSLASLRNMGRRTDLG